MKTFVCTSLLLSFAWFFPAGTAAQANCGEFVINALDRGWYDAGGNHNPGNDNYLCGDGTFGVTAVPLRNWFVFSIPVLTQQVVSASLRIRTFNIASAEGAETYQLRHVRMPVSTLRGGGTGLTSVYADLGDGAIYGSRIFYPDESSQSVSVPLNDVFMSNLIAAAGSALAIGGEISSLDDIPYTDEYLFLSSFGDSDIVQLVLAFPDPSPLAITIHPQSQTVPVGNTAIFNVQACGSSELSFQWQFNGTDLPGTGGPTVSIFNVSSNDAGQYRVIVSNASGVLTSEEATLTVHYAAPAVTAFVAYGRSPFYAGDSVTLCANVSGAPVPTLQWQLNGTNLPGERGICLPFGYLQTNQSGNYTVVASNALGVVTSAVFSLAVTLPPPVYAQFPAGQPPIAVGSFTYLCAVVNTSPVPALQWQFNGVDLPGETNQCLYFYPVDTNHAGLYTVRASDISGVHTSPPIDLTVYYEAPANPFLHFPLGSPAALAGNDVTICFSVGGSPPLSYQWRFNGVDLPGENASCLSLLQISTNQAGDYTLVANNVAGVVTSAVVTVSVDFQAPIFAAQPSDQTVVEGATVRLPALALAGPPATHVLQFNGTNLPVPFTYDGSGGFTLLDVTPADAGEYRVVASNALGIAESAVARLTVTPAGPLDRWTQRNPLPQSQRLLSITHGNGLFVAVGERGTILTSADGTNWFLQSRRVDLSLSGVAFGVEPGGGLFVAVGEGGTILTSADGTNWAYRYSAPFDLNAVTHGDGRFVAVGRGSFQTFVLSSADGVAWDRVAVPSVSADLGVAFGNGTFVAVGENAIITSLDGFDWSVARSSLASQLENVSFVQDQFIAVGDNGYMLASSDGTSWVSRNSGATRRLLGVTYGNGRFVTAGVRGLVFTSPDSITWTAAVSGTPDRLETINFANGLFIAAGENGTTITSPDGAAWTKQNFGITRDLDGMAVANGTIVIVGKGGSILTSTDGVDYTQRNAGTANDLHGISWGNGLWVAVGEPGTIVTSSNAIQWNVRSTGNSNSLKGATFGDGKWIVVGTEGAVITSIDGVNWSAAVTSPPYDLNDVAYGNGRFVIAADGLRSQNGSAFVSSNGVTWTWVNSFNFSKNLRSILFTNGTFFVTANDGYLFTSTNGVNWSGFYANIFRNLRAATFAHGLWIVVGNNGVILTSTNFADWTVRPTRTFENLHEVVFFDGKLITIGNRGTVLQSERWHGSDLAVLDYEAATVDPQGNVSGGFLLQIRAVTGRRHRLEASPNLMNWTTILTFTNTQEEIQFLDPAARTLPRRFYRLITE